VEADRVNPSSISLVVFACVFGGSLLGIALRKVLPEQHLTPETKSVVTLGMGMVATMAALVLGLMVASAQGVYQQQRDELMDVSSKIVVLDHLLAHYGPETRETRDLLRNTVARAINQFWPQGNAAELTPRAEAEGLYTKILELVPKDDTQRTLKDQALSTALDLLRTRWLVHEQETASVSTPLLIVVVFWLTIIFLSFGLFAPSNGLVISTLFVCSLSVSGAIFLVLELYRPFEGLVQLSSAPIRNALAQLGH
jgi:hypothetical protein